MATTGRTHPATSAEAILQFVLDALHHLTGLPLLMVNQPDHNVPCLTRTNMIETQMRADQKNAELLDSPSSRHKGHFSEWSDDEAPEEEMSDLSSDEEESEKQDNKMNAADAAPSSTAQNQLFDGLQFYLAVSQVRERTVRSVLELGMAKTMTTLQERKQNESIAVIEQRYPDFTCLPTKKPAAFGVEQPPLDLLAALRLPSAAAVVQRKSPMKGLIRAHLAVDEEGRVVQRRVKKLLDEESSAIIVHTFPDNAVNTPEDDEKEKTREINAEEDTDKVENRVGKEKETAEDQVHEKAARDLDMLADTVRSIVTDVEEAETTLVDGGDDAIEMQSNVVGDVEVETKLEWHRRLKIPPTQSLLLVSLHQILAKSATALQQQREM
ncbi:hypothetical protein JG688_00001974 [Phytophthora aleatoria]|uniref:Uncharacterized protein n=1 Tax=Phytophthora aleatoria TaxID=2496075 RepID=A0A8J5JG05_9STRA|nr:hypothetical protein JG688_00001974 [Phytophthora aleatoria]